MCDYARIINVCIIIISITWQLSDVALVNMQTLMNQRDRVRLIQYQMQLKPDSQEWFYARKVLQDSVCIALCGLL